MTTEHVKCLIIGSGPAGYTAAIYAGRANIAPVLYEGIQPGGQLTITTEVENFPGYPEGVTGPVLMDDLRRQAARFGADIRSGIIVKADLSQAPYHFWTDDEKEITADTAIIATGATAKYLGLEDEKKYAGMGVSACATCDGFFYRKKTVAVVGGGDTACEEAIYLAGLAKQVYLVVRKPYLRASKIMQERVLNHPNIQVLFEHNAIGRCETWLVVSPLQMAFPLLAIRDKRRKIVCQLFLVLQHEPKHGSRLHTVCIRTDSQCQMFEARCPIQRNQIFPAIVWLFLKDPFQQALVRRRRDRQASSVRNHSCHDEIVKPTKVDIKIALHAEPRNTICRTAQPLEHGTMDHAVIFLHGQALRRAVMDGPHLGRIELLFQKCR